MMSFRQVRHILTPVGAYQEWVQMVGVEKEEASDKVLWRKSLFVEPREKPGIKRSLSGEQLVRGG